MNFEESLYEPEKPLIHSTINRMLLKTYKFRLFPNKEQQILFEKHFGCARFIYNWGLEKKIEHYTKTKKTISFFDFSKMLPTFKEEKPWLKEVNSQTLLASLRNLDNAFAAFFRKQNNFPNFKAKHFSKSSFQCPQFVKLNEQQNLVALPKIPDIPIICHRKLEGKIKTVTVSKTPTGKYFASFLVEKDGELPSKLPITEDFLLGIDVGLKDFIVTSNGERVSHPKYLQHSQNRLAIHQRRFSKLKKGSKNRQKQKLKVALIHEKITNQRKDFLHKLTRKLVNDSQVTAFGLEDLNISGMVKNHKLAKAIASSGWRMFKTFLSYKSDETGKTIIEIPRFAPSSKLCNVCGKINKNLKLSERVWECSCGSVNDRDFNAAKNVKVFSWLQLHRPSGTAGDVKESFAEGTSILLDESLVEVSTQPNEARKPSSLS
jgi:putative transposase